VTAEPRRRRYPRLAARHALLVERLDDENDARFAATRGVGLGGLAFAADGAYGDGARLRLRITVGHDVIDADGRVVWERQVDGGWEIGVEFERLGEGDRGRLALLLAEAGAD
jgi:hypothetical protein